MKPVPEHIVASGPVGTNWYGGAVDRAVVSLRVMPKVRGGSVDTAAISKALGCDSSDKDRGKWRLRAPEVVDGNLDSRVDWILARVTKDPAVWRELVAAYRVDLFFGLFIERANRGFELSPTTMSELGSRGIQVGFDIYTPEK